MAIIPSRLSGVEIDPTGRYRCPLCGSQIAGDSADTSWVRCPMLADQVICLGCCVDHQAVARADDFDSHPFRDLFVHVARVTGSTSSELRRRCLQHQASILESIPDVAPDDEDARAVAIALSRMQSP